MKNILITGITGSGGSYLADYILENHKVGVHGICRWHSTATFTNIEHIKDRITLHECDLLDVSSIIRALKEIRPTKIFHLAAYANVRKCFDTPLSVINNNVMGTANLLESIRLTCPEAIIQICSTAEVYGNPLTTPMAEYHPQNPVNPYSVSKQTQESLAYSYYKSWGLRCIITRMFAYINPRRHDIFATAFARQVAELERKRTNFSRILYHGNLNSIRTLIDVRDAMRTYWIACEKCELGVPYNIGGRDTISIGDVLKRLIGLAKYPIKFRQDPALLRPVDITNQIPNTSKFDKLTGWEPQYTLDESLEFLLEHCRNEIY